MSKTAEKDIHEWLGKALPKLLVGDKTDYTSRLIGDGFDSLDLLSNVLPEDLLFMKKGHRRAIIKTYKLGERDDPDSMDFDFFDQLLYKRTPKRQNFGKCTITPLLPGLENSVGIDGEGECRLDLAAFLQPLLMAHDEFLPKTLYVREEMRTMFQELISVPQLDTANEAEAGVVVDPEPWHQKILVGSPGVGKSVLFFLAALKRAVLFPDKRVLYVRKTGQEPGISVFLMEVGGDECSVNVIFSRQLSKIENPNLTEMVIGLVEDTGLVLNDFYVMLDGPNHDHPLSERLNDGYAALCTSAGFPARAQEAINAIKILVLSGWTEPCIKRALVALGKSEQEADEIYELCGGRIRLALMKEVNVKKWFKEVVNIAGKGTIKLAATSVAAAGYTENSDRLRTRFYDQQTGKNSMIVDSLYLFNELVNELQSGDLVAAYNLAKCLRLQAARGWFYEEIANREFKQNHDMPQVTGWKKFDCKAKVGVAKFVQDCLDDGGNVYWVPSVPNFANIDAAILIGTKLVCFQYTVKTTHTFDEDSFWQGFLEQMVLEGLVGNASVVFVTPSDVNFNNDHKDFAYSYSDDSGGAQLWSSANMRQLPCSFHTAQVDADSTESIARDIRANLLPYLN